MGAHGSGPVLLPRGLGLSVLATGLATGLGCCLAAPAAALIPYVYLPQGEELEASALSIAQTAAQVLQTGQLEEAASLADLSVRLLPSNPRSWLLLAEARLRNRDSAAAREALAQAKLLDPDNAGVWFAEASLAMADDDFAHAETLIRTGLTLDPDNGNAYFDLGNALFLQGEGEEALAAFQEAAARRDNFWAAINNQGLVLYEADQPEAAMERWRQAIAINDQVAEPELALAAALYKQGDRGESTIGMTIRALDREPDYVEEDFQESQLWGEKLRLATRDLFTDSRLQNTLERARAIARLRRLERDSTTPLPEEAPEEDGVLP
ncbi:MAG: tetratricopeptide repeat protein [Cyanobacteria bacterium MAG IRC1_bin_28]|nr:tetratricopeptide repeat protein [Cyanobacteria bacterium MAG IRC1_bin_28]